MISHGKEIRVFCGNSNPRLAEEICSQLYMKLGDCTVGQFADGECSISVYEPVRGKDVFIVQSTCTHVNDNLMELLIMIDAMRRASAGRITAVIPYFGYARQDRKAKSRDPISAKLVANLITAAGADRVLTMDLHAAQIQGFFDIPVDNLMGAKIFAKHYAKIFGKNNDDVMVVSPDVGSTARVRTFSMSLGLNMAIVDKRREKANQSEVMNIIGNVEGKTCILLDRPRPSRRSAARRRSSPARPTACSPAPRSSASKTAAFRSCCCSTPSPIPPTSPNATRSSTSPPPPCSPRRSAAFTRKFPFPAFSTDRETIDPCFPHLPARSAGWSSASATPASGTRARATTPAS